MNKWPVKLYLLMGNNEQTNTSEKTIQGQDAEYDNSGTEGMSENNNKARERDRSDDDVQLR